MRSATLSFKKIYCNIYVLQSAHRFYQPPDSKFESIQPHPSWISTGELPPQMPPPSIFDASPLMPDMTTEPSIQPASKITVEAPTEFKETQISFENPVIDAINLEYIYINYSPDDVEELKPPNNEKYFNNIFKE